MSRISIARIFLFRSRSKARKHTTIRCWSRQEITNLFAIDIRGVVSVCPATPVRGDSSSGSEITRLLFCLRFQATFTSILSTESVDSQLNPVHFRIRAAPGTGPDRLHSETSFSSRQAEFHRSESRSPNTENSVNNPMTKLPRPDIPRYARTFASAHSDTLLRRSTRRLRRPNGKLISKKTDFSFSKIHPCTPPNHCLGYCSVLLSDSDQLSPSAPNGTNSTERAIGQ